MSYKTLIRKNVNEGYNYSLKLLILHTLFNQIKQSKWF